MLSFLATAALFATKLASSSSSDDSCISDDNLKTQSTDCQYDTNSTLCLNSGCCYEEQTIEYQCGTTTDEGAIDEASCLENESCWNSSTLTCYDSFNYIKSNCRGSQVSLSSQTYADCMTNNAANCWDGTNCYTEFVPSCYDQNVTISISSYCDTLQWQVDFVGKSGQFKLFPCADSNFFIKVNPESIQGYDSKGKKTKAKVTSFSYASAEVGEYSQSSLYTYDGTINSGAKTTTLGGVRLNYSFVIESSTVDMLMYAYLLENDYQLVLGNTSYILKQSSLKFSYDIIGFPVADYDVSTIDFQIKLTTGGKMKNGAKNSTGKFSWGQDCQTSGCGSFSFEGPETATIDGTTGDFVDVDFDTSGSGKEATVTFTFNVTDGDNDGLVDISYDPWIAGNYDDGSSTSSDSSNLSSNFALYIAMGILSFFIF